VSRRASAFRPGGSTFGSRPAGDQVGWYVPSGSRPPVVATLVEGALDDAAVELAEGQRRRHVRAAVGDGHDAARSVSEEDVEVTPGDPGQRARREISRVEEPLEGGASRAGGGQPGRIGGGGLFHTPIVAKSCRPARKAPGKRSTPGGDAARGRPEEEERRVSPRPELPGGSRPRCGPRPSQQPQPGPVSADGASAPASSLRQTRRQSLLRRRSRTWTRRRG
jgi:hypothetical protein